MVGQDLTAKFYWKDKTIEYHPMVLCQSIFIFLKNKLYISFHHMTRVLTHLILFQALWESFMRRYNDPKQAMEAGH